MYTILEKVLNVKWFALDLKGHCLYNDKESIYSLESKKVIYKHHIDLQEIFYEDKFFINDLYGKGLYFDNKLQPQVFDKYIHLIRDDFVILSKRENEERNTYIENLRTNESNKIKLASTIYKLYDNSLVRKNFETNCVETFNFPAGVPLWQFDLSELGEYKPLRKDTFQKYEVIKFLGVWHDELLVACSNGLILCLDINNGQETRRFHKCPPYVLGSKTYDHFDNASSFVYDDKKEILFALQTFYYMEVNLQSGDINITDLKEDMGKNQISLYRRSSGYAWDDTHIYTIGEVANHESGVALGDRCLLAYNRSSQNIDWRYIFENDSINTDIPQLSGDKLYQLSANKNLHIFQKEEQTIN